jgi:hypothetical protein
VTLGSQRRAGMTVVIQLSYIHRGLLRAAKPTYKKGHSLNIWTPLFCWSLLLRQSIYLMKYFVGK